MGVRDFDKGVVVDAVAEFAGEGLEEVGLGRVSWYWRPPFEVGTEWEFLTLRGRPTTSKDVV